MNREERTAAAREAIKEATAKGFMDCKTIVQALYPERYPDRPVRWDAAYRWLADVWCGWSSTSSRMEITDVPKAERTGCWAADPSRRSWRTRTAYYAADRPERLDAKCRGRWRCRPDFSRDGSRGDDGAASACAKGVFVDTAWKATGTKARDKEPPQEKPSERQSERDHPCGDAVGGRARRTGRASRRSVELSAVVVGFERNPRRCGTVLWAQVQQENTA